MNTTFFLFKKKKNQRPNWPKLKAQKTDNQPKPKLIEFQPFRSILVENFTNQKFRFWLANPKKTNQTKPITGLPKTFLLNFLYCTKICSWINSTISHQQLSFLSPRLYIYPFLSHTNSPFSCVPFLSHWICISFSKKKSNTY